MQMIKGNNFPGVLSFVFPNRIAGYDVRQEAYGDVVETAAKPMLPVVQGGSHVFHVTTKK